MWWQHSSLILLKLDLWKRIEKYSRRATELTAKFRESQKIRITSAQSKVDNDDAAATYLSLSIFISYWLYYRYLFSVFAVFLVCTICKSSTKSQSNVYGIVHEFDIVNICCSFSFWYFQLCVHIRHWYSPISVMLKDVDMCMYGKLVQITLCAYLLSHQTSAILHGTWFENLLFLK